MEGSLIWSRPWGTIGWLNVPHVKHRGRLLIPNPYTAYMPSPASSTIYHGLPVLHILLRAHAGLPPHPPPRRTLLAPHVPHQSPASSRRLHHVVRASLLSLPSDLRSSVPCTLPAPHAGPPLEPCSPRHLAVAACSLPPKPCSPRRLAVAACALPPKPRQQRLKPPNPLLAVHHQISVVYTWHQSEESLIEQGLIEFFPTCLLTLSAYPPPESDSTAAVASATALNLFLAPNLPSSSRP
ncbi:hypothetical protein GUJ93_ZPchr0008g12821 [Zizania palustris]|uniref:Uncharacterized protein n=1 Tax=Zizania palustris TaxID=103762 RepID=A0A8J5RLK3_ZIZPA|nr:hypothetical protein GUJ93_ZPchr0008g12821 [Zizania palustris]